MRIYLYFFVACCLSSCNNPGSNKIATVKDSITVSSDQDSARGYYYKFPDTALEKRITVALMKLPFVKKSNHYIDSFSHHTHALSFILDTAGKNISVIAGFDGKERFETYYDFEVDPSTMKIKIMDIVEGKMIPVKQYIKEQK